MRVSTSESESRFSKIIKHNPCFTDEGYKSRVAKTGLEPRCLLELSSQSTKFQSQALHSERLVNVSSVGSF